MAQHCLRVRVELAQHLGVVPGPLHPEFETADASEEPRHPHVVTSAVLDDRRGRPGHVGVRELQRRLAVPRIGARVYGVPSRLRRVSGRLRRRSPGHSDRVT